MKNRKVVQYGIIMLFFFLSFSFISCQKEVLPTQQESTEDVTISSEEDASVSAQATTRKNILFSFTGESSTCLDNVNCSSNIYWCSLQGWASYSFGRSSTYKRSGSYSIRYELRKTDGDVIRSKRAESNRATFSEPTGKCERWYGVSYYLPSDYVTDPAAESLTQWYPGLSLWTINGQWCMVQFGDYNNQKKFLGYYDKNKWTDFVFHIKWSAYSDGLIEVWKNGVKVWYKTGKTTADPTANCPYFKTGIYKWPWKSTGAAQSITTKRIAYIDDMREGSSLATYADVAPGP